MNTKLIAAAVIIFSTAISVPAFARGGGGGGVGGVGPAGPVGYNWLNTSQGQSVQRVGAERQGDRDANAAYGGSNSTTSQSGMSSSANDSDNESH